MLSATSSGRTNCVAPANPRGRRQVGVDRPAAAEPAELVVGALHGGVAVGIPADRDLADHPAHRRAARWPAARRARRRPVLLSGSTAIRWSPAARRCRTERSPDTAIADRHRRLRQIPQPGGIDLEVLALPVDDLAAEQLADDLDGFLSISWRRSTVGQPLADDVLVEVLAAAQPEGEPAVGEDLQRRGLLRDDRRVVAHRRARHVRRTARPARWRGRPRRAPSTRTARGPARLSHGK